MLIRETINGVECLTVPEFARAASVSRATVYNWIKQRRIQALRSSLAKNNGIRIPKNQLPQFNSTAD